eukprot:gb/GECH01012577.1/.p1 GENE.gb/GECH01012577.1/~~gb/GECH01012577.1/.p1  ORF type:complete len:516 (+),score=72.18 gb/GECH01012577.1/:1-1548(+)
MSTDSNPTIQQENTPERNVITTPVPEVESSSLIAQSKQPLLPRWCMWLCLLSFLDSFKPSEPFLVPYLKSCGLSSQDIDVKVFPVWSYAYFGALLLVGPISEAIGYRSILIAGVLGRLYTRLVLLFAPHILPLVISTQVAYGLASAEKIMLFAYIYNNTAPKQYHFLTSTLSGVSLTGHVLAAFTGQLFISVFNLSFNLLFWISLVSVTLSFPLVLFFIPKSQTHHRFKLSSVLEVIKGYFHRSFALYSLWLICGSAIGELVFNWETPLFDAVDPSKDLNGVVAGISRLTGAIGGFIPPLLSYKRWTGWISLSIGTAIVAGILAISATTGNIWVVYTTYIIFYLFYQALYCLASSRVAANIPHNFYAVVTSSNTLFAVGIQTSLQAALNGTKMAVQNMYVVFAVYCGILALAFPILFALSYLPWRCRSTSTNELGNDSYLFDRLITSNSWAPLQSIERYLRSMFQEYDVVSGAAKKSDLIINLNNETETKENDGDSSFQLDDVSNATESSPFLRT